MSADTGPAITMYTTQWCGDCRSAKRVMAKHGIAYAEHDITDDREARELVMRLNHGNRTVPTILMPSGAVLAEPSPPQLEQALRDEGFLA